MSDKFQELKEAHAKGAVIECWCDTFNEWFVPREVAWNPDLEYRIKRTAEVPIEPDRALLASMAMRYRHDFGLLDKRAQESLISTMRQIHEEVVGKGFYSREQRERYLQMMEKQNA
jgi:hypothetical protein